MAELDDDEPGGDLLAKLAAAFPGNASAQVQILANPTLKAWAPR